MINSENDTAMILGYFSVSKICTSIECFNHALSVHFENVP
jgi:hypothetical protein